jgi:hypothetical protein
MERKRRELIRTTIEVGADGGYTGRLVTERVRYNEDDKAERVGEPVIFETALMNPCHTPYAALLGLKNRIHDSTAERTGATFDDRLANARNLVGHYESGSAEWDMRPAARGPTKTAAQLLAELSDDQLEAMLAARKAAKSQG